jgi:hypothetical protein
LAQRSAIVSMMMDQLRFMVARPPYTRGAVLALADLGTPTR